jgi:murein peptide amidase A
VQQQASESRDVYVVLIAVGLAMMSVVVFLFAQSGPTTRVWTPQAQNDPTSASEAASAVQSKLDAHDETSRPLAIRSDRSGHPETGGGVVLPAPAVEMAKPLAPKVSVAETIIGHSVEGRPLVCRTVGDGEYVVLMIASIHGNESAGTPLLNRLAEQVVETPELLAGVTLVLLPVVNPDGVENRGRYNTRGVDLNRNFPADNRENSSRYGLNALSEPESLAIYQVMNDVLPNHIVTLHEPLQCVDYDGPAEALAAAMSEYCPLPVKKLGSRPGSLGSYAGVTLGIPTITFELPRNAATQPPELLWRFYGEALIQAVLHRHAANE